MLVSLDVVEDEDAPQSRRQGPDGFLERPLDVLFDGFSARLFEAVFHVAQGNELLRLDPFLAQVAVCGI